MNVFPDEIVCATSTKADGNMGFRFGEADEVRANRSKFLAKHGIALDACVPMKSEHGTIIKVVTAQNKGTSATSRETALEADVLVTQEKDLALLLTTADCQAVSLYDPVTHTIALAHISRHTLAQGLAQKTITFMRERFAVNPAHLLISISPHIKKDSYKFKAPLEKVAPLMEPFIEEKDGFAHLNTETACLAQLKASGVLGENIVVSNIDTATHPDYFSYYVANRNNTQDGRMATVVMMGN